LTLLAAGASGCGVILGLDAFTEGSGSTSTGAGGSGGTAVTSSSGPVCTPGTMLDCKYTGATSTQNVGPCRAGVQTCNKDGSGYDTCTDEVLPAMKDDCSNDIDDDCNGTVNDGCKCKPGTAQDCYDGMPPSTKDTGICVHGTQSCKADGSDWEACTGETLPALQEDCSNSLDDDCNGQVNDGCPCVPGSMQPCYGGPMGTAGTGICHGGTQTCNANGLGYGACLGEQQPLPEDCSTPLDEDCNSIVVDPAQGCVCAPSSTTSCYTGPNNTSGVGLCKPGTHACSADGKSYGACMGEVKPIVEDCTKLGDEDCDGFACSETLWAHTYGDPSQQSANSVAVDAAGEVYVAGSFIGGMQVPGGINLTSAGSYDMFLLKFKADGTPIWGKAFGTALDEGTSAVTTDAVGNVYLSGGIYGATDFGCGTVQPGIFAVKLNPAGTCLWSTSCSTTGSATGASIAANATSVVVAGSFAGTISCAGLPMASSVGPSADVVFVRFSAAGVPNLLKTFGDASDQQATNVAIDGTGAIVIAGILRGGPVTFGGINFTDTGGMGSGFLARFNSAGTHTFSNAWPYSQGNAVAIDSANSMIVTGYLNGTANFGGGNLTTAGGQDVFVAKYTSGGVHLWSKLFGDAAYQHGDGVAIGAMDSVVLTGGMTSTINFGGGNLVNHGSSDTWVAKLTAGGAHLWSRSLGGSGSEGPYDVALGPAGEVHLVGGFNGTTDLGLGPVTAAGTIDMFVVKLAP
jgi:hypothetical protein